MFSEILEGNNVELDIREYLSSFEGQPISYIPNPGNGGDALIASGTYQLFDELGLRHTIVNRDRASYAGETVMYGGGGNLGLMKNFSARLLSRIHKATKRLVILPHTIKSVTPLLEQFGSNVDVICRERVSYTYVKSIVKQANVYLADDMALQLNAHKLASVPPNLPRKIRVATDYARFKFLGQGGRQPPSLFAIPRLFRAEQLVTEMASVACGPVLHAYRTDSERTSIPLPADNVDVSEILTMGVETRELADLNSHYFLSFLKRFQLVKTNRLHVCIGALLLGIPVEFHGNSYYKCRAVYEYSLKRFDNLKYMEDGE